MDKTIFHPYGLVEIHTLEGMLVLTDEEYQRAKRRGESVLRNRNYSKAMKEILGDPAKILARPTEALERSRWRGTNPRLNCSG